MSNIVPSEKDLVWVVCQGGVFVGFDPDAHHLNHNTNHVAFEPLTTPRVAIDSDGVRYPIAEDLQPRLAVGWEPSDDYQTWVIKLRQGVKSPAGNELTSEDVKWVWDRVYALRSVGMWRTKRIGGVQSAEDVEPLDRYTLRFKLVGPNPEFAQYLSMQTNNVVDSVEARKHVTEEDPWATKWLQTHAPGFGAFALDEVEPTAVRFRARDDFWAGRPGLNTFSQVAATSREDALRMIEQGEANAMLCLYTDEFKRFADRAGFTLQRVRANHSMLMFDYKEPPFDRQDVRQAVCYALPYREIMSTVYEGYGQLNKSPFCNVSKYYTEEFWHYDTNPARARELLKAAGYGDGFATELYVKDTVESTRFGEVVARALKGVGIEVAVKDMPDRLPEGQTMPMWFKDECGHALCEAMYDMGHDFDPPVGLYGSLDVRNKRWTDMMRTIRRSPSKDQPTLYRELQRDILEFAPAAQIAELQTGWVFRGEIDPWVTNPLNLGVNTTVWSGHRPLYKIPVTPESVIAETKR